VNYLSSFEKQIKSITKYLGVGDYLDKKLTINRIRACEEEIWHELMSMTRNTQIIDIEGKAADKASKLIRMIIEDIQK